MEGIATTSEVAIEASLAAASEAVGENGQPLEAEKLLLMASGTGVKHALGAQQENHPLKFKCSDIELENYETDMKTFLTDLHDTNIDCGIKSDGEDFWEQEQELHFFWAFGVEPHTDVHTSLGIIYQSSKNKFVMLKIDLQDTSENLIAATGSKIFIMHEVRVVEGINRDIWSETERAVDMSLTDLLSIIKRVMDGMDNEYSLLRNNCIRYV